MTTTRFKHITIIGVGLIGGSVARAIRRSQSDVQIVGFGRNTDNLDAACELGVIDRYETDLSAAIQGADLIVIASPVGEFSTLMSNIGQHLEDTTIITDVGSVKQSVIDASEALGDKQKNFVPGHPIAGTEKSGVEASFAELFDDRVVLLTPTEQTDASATDDVKVLWEMMGASVTLMDASHHDQVLAATSHLPHILAYALVDSLARNESHDEIFNFAAGGFRDFTRIASSSPDMWKDICLGNKKAVLEVMDNFMNDLSTLRLVIENQDAETLLKIFANAKQARDSFTSK